jgi:hypothetical protein
MMSNENIIITLLLLVVWLLISLFGIMFVGLILL